MVTTYDSPDRIIVEMPDGSSIIVESIMSFKITASMAHDEFATIQFTGEAQEARPVPAERNSRVANLIRVIRFGRRKK